MTSLLETRRLGASYRTAPVLHDVDCAVAQSGITAVLGANGAGKTTLLRAICGMVRTSGEILLEGKRIDGARAEEAARHGIAHVPDGRGTFVDLTVEENLRLGAYLRRDKRVVAEDMERVFLYFPRLKERLQQQAGTLSGGEQQMLAIGRALMLRPRLLLMDEPSFGLAPQVVREIFRIVESINKKDGVAILLVEQNASLALDIADNVYLLETGRIILSGDSAVMRGNDLIRRSYLGY